MTRALARLARAALGGVLGTLAAAAFEARWAGEALGEEGSLGRLWLHEVSLLAPLGIAIALAVGATSILVLPRRPLSSLPFASAAAFLLPPALVLWMTLVAGAARFAMARIDSSLLTGLAMAGAGLGITLVLGGAGALGSWCFFRYPHPPAPSPASGESEPARPKNSLENDVPPPSSEVGEGPRMGVHLFGGTLLAAALLAFGIASGTTSGEGGVWGIWGVLKRPELDLRPAALLGLIVLFSLLGPLLFRRLSAPLSATLALAPLALGIRTLAHFDPEIAMAIERGAPLGKHSLRVLERAGFDRVATPAFPEEELAALDESLAEDAPEASAPLPTSLRDRIPKDLNVLLITVDTLRADLGFAGYPKPVSPRLDELATRSTVFERAYALASYTGKSIGPFLSGKYPSETHRGFSHFNRYPKADIMVTERLSAASVRTMGFQAHWYFSKASGLARGFDAWDMSAQAGFEVEADSNITGHKLTDALLGELSKEENVESRFFVWAHYIDPHAEYVSHEGAPDFGRGMRADYDGEVWFTDKQIGRVLDFVSAQPWGERTAIIVTSDHGEAFGEHGMIRHGFELWEELVRIPLIVYVPGLSPKRISERRSVIDVVPTLLDLFHVDPPGEDASAHDFLSGVSLLEDLVMPEGHTPRERDIFIDMPAGPANGERRAFIHGDLKLSISNGSYYQLFDLESDPAEKQNLFRDEDQRSRILPRYRAFQSRLREVVVKAVEP